MEFDDSLVTFILATYYNMRPIVGSMQQLCGYSDKNYSFVEQSDSKKYVLKIVNKDESDPNLTAIIDEMLDNAHQFCQDDSSRLLFVVPKLIKTTGNKLSTFTAVKHRHSSDSKPGDDNNDHADFRFVQCNLRLCEHFDGVTMLDLINRYPSKYKPEELYRKLGRMASQLFRFFRTQGHLTSKLKGLRKGFPWQLIGSDEIVERNLNKLYPEPASVRRSMVEKVLNECKTIKPKLTELPQFVFHSDLCNRNILVDPNQSVVMSDANKLCLIDFQDIQVGPQVAELAILILYSILEQEQMPFDKALKLIPKWIFAGYQSSDMEPIPAEQVKFISTLIKLRLVHSLLNGQVAFEEDPSNVDYVMHTNQRGWQLLEMMTSETDKDLGAQLYVPSAGAEAIELALR